MTTKIYNYLAIMPRLVKNIGESYNFPLGIAYISSTLKKAGFRVYTLNLNHIEGEIESIIQNVIIKENIHTVLTGGLSFQYTSVKDIVDAAHNCPQKVRIIVGGGLITGGPQVAMQALEHVDIGVIGEGEITIVELLKTLEENGDLSKVNGIIFKKNKMYHITEKRKEIMDLETIPMPDYEGFDLDKYLDIPSMSILNVQTDRAAFMIGSRSCPYQCTFCFHTVGKIYRQRSIDSVLSEIKYLKDKYNIKLVRMSDELFARKKDRLKIFAEKMKEWGLKFTAYFRVDDIDEELIEIMKNSTCCSMDLGLESADNRILKSMKKHITIEQTEKALKLIYDAGLPTTGNFIFGDIEETFETATNTLNWWKNHREYSIGLHFINAYPGSYVYKYAVDKGIIKDEVKFLKEGCPQVNLSKMTIDEQAKLAKKILEATYELGEKLQNPVLLENKKNGRIKLQGTCNKCGTQNYWNNVRLFVGGNWVTCKNCGQQYLPDIPHKLKDILIKNIQRILNKKNKIALWGVTPYTIGLYENEKIFENKSLILIDAAEMKQLITIKGKKVNSPDILLEEKDIDTVIFFYPNSIETITRQIKHTYPNVKEVIDVTKLVEDTKDIVTI